MTFSKTTIGGYFMRNIRQVIALLAGTSLFATPLFAQDAPPAAASGTAAKVDAGQAAAEPAKPEAPKGDFTLDIGLAGVTDYRFRGISLTNKKAAFQPSVTLTHSSGFHVGSWLSNVAPNGGENVEVDFIGGWGKTLGPIDFDVNATYYYYPGAHPLDYVEFISTASHAFGPLTLGTTFAYTPKQGSVVPSRGLYGAVNAAFAIPKTPLTVTGSFGLEDNAFYSNKRDWSIGVSADVAGFTIGASYVKASHIFSDPLGKGRFLLSLSRSFSTSF